MFAILIYIFAVIGVFSFLVAAFALGFLVYDWLSGDEDDEPEVGTTPPHLLHFYNRGW